MSEGPERFGGTDRGRLAGHAHQRTAQGSLRDLPTLPRGKLRNVYCARSLVVLTLKVLPQLVLLGSEGRVGDEGPDLQDQQP